MQAAPNTTTTAHDEDVVLKSTTGIESFSRNERLLFFDNLRTFVIVLVVLVHVAIINGGLGSEGITPAQPSPATTFVLAWFSSVNLAFFMGLLFFIAGHFTPGSLARRGSKGFFTQRLLRLGVPLIFYDLFINPPIVYIRMTTVNGTTPSLGEFLENYLTFVQGIGTGPMWFVSNLLLFSLGYGLFYTLVNRKPQLASTRKEPPGNRSILMFLVFLGIAAFTSRLVFPVGWQTPLNIRLPYYWQYLTFYVLGTIAWRYQWVARWPDSLGRLWFWIGFVAALLFPAVVILGGPQLMGGGLNPAALAFSFWEAAVALGLGLGLLLLFRQRYNEQGTLLRAMSASAYAVYIIHVPLILIVQLAMQPFALPAMLNFMLVSLVAVPLCFAMSYFILLRLPLAREIL
jgi:hypothetical protein